MPRSTLNKQQGESLTKNDTDLTKAGSGSTIEIERSRQEGAREPDLSTMPTFKEFMRGRTPTSPVFRDQPIVVGNQVIKTAAEFNRNEAPQIARTNDVAQYIKSMKKQGYSPESVLNHLEQEGELLPGRSDLDKMIIERAFVTVAHEGPPSDHQTLTKPNRFSVETVVSKEAFKNFCKEVYRDEDLSERDKSKKIAVKIAELAPKDVKEYQAIQREARKEVLIDQANEERSHSTPVEERSEGTPVLTGDALKENLAFLKEALKHGLETKREGDYFRSLADQARDYGVSEADITRVFDEARKNYQEQSNPKGNVISPPQKQAESPVSPASPRTQSATDEFDRFLESRTANKDKLDFKHGCMRKDTKDQVHARAEGEEIYHRERLNQNLKDYASFETSYKNVQKQEQQLLEQLRIVGPGSELSKALKEVQDLRQRMDDYQKKFWGELKQSVDDYVFSSKAAINLRYDNLNGSIKSGVFTAPRWRAAADDALGFYTQELNKIINDPGNNLSKMLEYAKRLEKDDLVNHGEVARKLGERNETYSPRALASFRNEYETEYQRNRGNKTFKIGPAAKAAA